MALIVWNWYRIKQIKQNVFYQIYLFPLLILVWVNTHGGFIYGCLFLLCVGLGETINQVFYQQNALPRKIYYHLLLALFLSAGCTLVTPYGYDYIYQIVMQNFDKQLQIDVSNVHAYFTTFEIVNNPQLTVFADTAIAIILLVFGISLYKKQLDFVPIISNLVFAFLFTRYARSILPWIAVFSLSIVYYCSAVFVIQTRKNVFLIATFAMATFLLSGWFLHHEYLSPSKGVWLEFGVSEKSVVDEEIDFINKKYPNARLGNMYNHGAYILWKMWPQRKVMMDARYFPYKSWSKDYFDFRKGINVETFIQKYPFDIIPIPHFDLIQNWFHKSKEWKLVFYGKNAAVFARSSIALPGGIIRGENLNNIRAFFTASGAFYTSILIRDWLGTDIVLNTMKRNFIQQDQQKTISGFTDIKLAAQMFEQKDYSSAIISMEKAFAKQAAFGHDLYAAALLMKAIEDWQNKQWSAAITNTIYSLRVKDSFAANYNLALMTWKIDTMEQKKQSPRPPLVSQQKEITTRWQNLFAALVQNKQNYPQHYAQFIENANSILNGNTDIQTQLIVPEYP